MTSRAQFTSQQRFQFDGITFRAGVASTVSQHVTTIDRICAKRRGPIGRLIECVGRRMADEATAEINSVAEEFSEALLSQTLDDQRRERLLWLRTWGYARLAVARWLTPGYMLTPLRGYRR